MDEQLHSDVVDIATKNSPLVEKFPQYSFQRVFWQQQMEAISKKDAHSMRWHPPMIRYCLYLGTGMPLAHKSLSISLLYIGLVLHMRHFGPQVVPHNTS